jgi:hypothetical protein
VVAWASSIAEDVRLGRQFLDLWKHADHDLPLLADVRRELAALPASGAK